MLIAICPSFDSRSNFYRSELSVKLGAHKAGFQDFFICL